MAQSGSMKILEYPDRSVMAVELADTLAGKLRMALKCKDRVSFAVPGGTTPVALFESLREASLDWGRVDVTLTDERWVPESDVRSNMRLLKQELLTGLAGVANLAPLYTHTETPEEGTALLCEAIEPLLPLDLIVLGMGNDMHTASLFPGADGLSAALDPHAPILLPMRAPGAPEPRVTLSLPVLRGASDAHLLIAGADKRKALEKAHELDDPEVAPVSALLNGITVHWAP